MSVGKGITRIAFPLQTWLLPVLHRAGQFVNNDDKTEIDVADIYLR